MPAPPRGIKKADALVLLAAGATVAWGLVGAPTGMGAAVGCDRFAARAGSNAGSGSLARPYRTVQRLVRSLRRGETGCLRAGTYRFSQLIIDKRGLTLAPYRGAAVTLKGEIKVPPSGDGSMIKGMRLNGAGGKNEIGPRIYADRVVLRDNTITNQHRGICVHVGSWYERPPPRAVVIEGNRIHDCGQLPPTNHDHGIYLNEARGTIIRDNWIYDNADRGIQLYPAARGSLITGNVIARNGMGIAFSGAGGRTSNDNVVWGNVIVHSRVRWNAYSGPDGPIAHGNRLRRNCVFASRRSDHREHGGIETPSRNFVARRNLVARPRFLRPKRDNFGLRSSSRCRRVYTGARPG
jgi:parallel beta-helix repeat protein